MQLKEQYQRLKPEERLYQVDHPVIGLTGGIATGKSTVAKLFSDAGVPVVSADELVKHVYQATETIEFIKSQWPEALIDGIIDFPTLRRIAFADEQNREKIEQFIYARMPDAFKDFYGKFDSPELMVYDVPLLFEKNLAPLVDISVCVYCPREYQLRRLVARDNIDDELANQILDSQMDIEDKKEAADFILDNTGSLEELEKNFKNFLKRIS